MTRESERAPDSEVPAWVVRVRRLMAERGWSGRELARHVGVTSAWVSLTIVQGQRGTQPRRDTLVKLAQAFDEPVSLWLKLGGLSPEGADGAAVELMPRQSFAAFVDGDPELTDDQKRMLKDLYGSWVPSAKQRPEPQHVRRGARRPKGG